MHVAPAPAVPQAVAVVRVGEAPVPEVVVAPAAAVVAVVVVGWRAAPVKGCRDYLRSFGCSRGGKEDALRKRKLGKSFDE